MTSPSYIFREFNDRSNQEQSVSHLLRDGMLNQNIDLIRTSLLAGANPNKSIRHYKGGCSEPLKLISELNYTFNPEIIQLLLDFGADPNRVVTGNINAFCSACGNYRNDIALYFINHSAIDYFSFFDRWTSSMWASHYLSLDVMKAMQDQFEKQVLPEHPHLSKSHLWTSVNKEGENALLLSAPFPDSLTWLLEYPGFDIGSHLETKNKHGHTVLYEATIQGVKKSVSLLLSHGARVDVADAKGVRLEDLAKKGNTRVCELIQAACASHRATQSIHNLLNKQRGAHGFVNK